MAKDRFQAAGWLIEATEGSDGITAVSETGLTVNIDVNAGTITRTAGGSGDFTTNFFVGQAINLIGTDGNNNDGSYRITAVAATILTVVGLPGANETDTGGVSIYNTVPYYQFANYMKTWGEFPRLRSDIIPRYRGGSRDPYRIDVVGKSPLAQKSILPSNGLMLYLMYGGARQHPDGSPGDHQLLPWDVAPMSLANQPSFTERFATASSTNAIRKSVVGNKLHTYGFGLNLMEKKGMAGLIQYDGRRMIPVAANTEFNSLPVYPDANLEIDQRWYRWSEDFLFLWDSDLDWASPTGEDFSNDILSFDVQFNNFNTSEGGTTYKYPQWILEGNRSIAFTMNVLRGNDTKIFDAYMDQGADEVSMVDTFKDMIIKIYNTPTTFMRLDFDTMAIAEIGINHTAVMKNIDPEVFTIAGMFRVCVPTIKDGVPTALYGY